MAKRPTDTLRITGLEVSALIGVRAWERRVRQRLSIDLEIETDVANVALEDDVAHALDYGIIARDISDFVRSSEYHLIETLAERVAQRLFEAFPVNRLRITVHKPTAVPNARDTSVEIERVR